MKQAQAISELFTEKDLLVFDTEAREALGDPAALEYVVEPRITAVKVVMSYERGCFTSASTQKGAVTPSVKTILTVPIMFVPLRKESPVPETLEVRTDVYMEGEALAQLNRERTAKNLPPFSGPLAAVEDSLSQTDPRVSAKRPLNYFCSGAAKNAGLQAETHYELMVFLQELGLRVNRPHLKVAKGIHDVVESCEQLRGEKGNFPYPVEGALVRVNSLELQERLSRTRAWGMGVFKF